MACDIDDREGESPSPMEPDWGGCSTAWRPVAAMNKLSLRRSVFVKRTERPRLGWRGYWVTFGLAGAPAALRAAVARARGGGEDKGRRFALAGRDQSPLSQAIRARGSIAARDMA